MAQAQCAQRCSAHKNLQAADPAEEQGKGALGPVFVCFVVLFVLLLNFFKIVLVMRRSLGHEESSLLFS